MSSGPFRLLYADPQTRYHKLLPSGRRLPVTDYGPAAVWPREARGKRRRHVVFRIPSRAWEEPDELRFIVYKETRARGCGPPTLHAKCAACLYVNRQNGDKDGKKIGRIFIRAGRLIISDPRVPEGREHHCELICDSLRLKDPTPKPPRWRTTTGVFTASPWSWCGRVMTPAVRRRWRQTHPWRPAKLCERVTYPPHEDPPVSFVPSLPFQLLAIAVENLQRLAPAPEPPKPKPTRRVMFNTTRW